MKHLTLFSPTTIKAMYDDLSEAVKELDLKITEIYFLNEDMALLSEVYEGLTGESITAKEMVK